jgi:hypothetical protein
MLQPARLELEPASYRQKVQVPGQVLRTGSSLQLPKVAIGGFLQVPGVGRTDLSGGMVNPNPNLTPHGKQEPPRQCQCSCLNREVTAGDASMLLSPHPTGLANARHAAINSRKLGQTMKTSVLVRRGGWAS